VSGLTVSPSYLNRPDGTANGGESPDPKDRQLLLIGWAILGYVTKRGGCGSVTGKTIGVETRKGLLLSSRL